MATRYLTTYRSISGVLYTVELIDDNYSGVVNDFKIQELIFNCETENDDIYSEIAFTNITISSVNIGDFWDDVSTLNPANFKIKVNNSLWEFIGVIVPESSNRILAGNNIYTFNFSDININLLINKSAFVRTATNQIQIGEVSFLESFDYFFDAAYSVVSTLRGVDKDDFEADFLNLYYQNSTFESGGFAKNALEAMKSILKSFMLYLYYDYEQDVFYIRDIADKFNAITVTQDMFIDGMVEYYDEDFKIITTSGKTDFLNKLNTNLDIKDYIFQSGDLYTSDMNFKDNVSGANVLAAQIEFQDTGTTFNVIDSNLPFSVNGNLGVGDYKPITLKTSNNSDNYICYKSARVNITLEANTIIYVTNLKLKVDVFAEDASPNDVIIALVYQRTTDNQMYYYNANTDSWVFASTTNENTALRAAVFSGNSIEHNFFNDGNLELNIDASTVTSRANYRVYVFTRNTSTDNVGIGLGYTLENVSLSPIVERKNYYDDRERRDLTNSFSNREFTKEVDFFTTFFGGNEPKDFSKGVIQVRLSQDNTAEFTAKFLTYSDVTFFLVNTLELTNVFVKQQNNKRAKALEGSINVRGMTVLPNKNLIFNGKYYRVIYANYDTNKEILRGKWVELLFEKEDQI